MGILYETADRLSGFECPERVAAAGHKRIAAGLFAIGFVPGFWLGEFRKIIVDVIGALELGGEGGFYRIKKNPVHIILFFFEKNEILANFDSLIINYIIFFIVYSCES
jgi:hypothetical protein